MQPSVSRTLQHVENFISPRLIWLATQIEHIEDVVEKKYGLGAGKAYRNAKYEFASTTEAKNNLRLYWEELAKEYLSAPTDEPVVLNGRVTGGSYRSPYLDALHDAKVHLIGRLNTPTPHIEPTLEASDESSGVHRQAGYDHIRLAWERRAYEANEFPVVFQDTGAKTGLSRIFRDALPYFGKQFEFTRYTNCASNLVVVRYPQNQEVCEFLLTTEDEKDFELGRINFYLIFAPAHLKIRFSSYHSAREMGYRAISLSTMFPGYRYGYGHFRNSHEFELCIFAGLAFARETFAILGGEVSGLNTVHLV